MEVKFNVKKSFGYFLFMAVFLSMSLFLVGAYGGNNAPVMGHSGGEIEVTTTFGGSQTRTLNDFGDDVETADYSHQSQIDDLKCTFVSLGSNSEETIEVPQKCLKAGCIVKVSAKDIIGNRVTSYGIYSQDFSISSVQKFYLTKFRDNNVNGISFSGGDNGDSINTLLFNVHSTQGLKIMDDGNLEQDLTKWTKLDSSGSSSWDITSIQFC